MDWHNVMEDVSPSILSRDVNIEVIALRRAVYTRMELGSRTSLPGQSAGFGIFEHLRTLFLELWSATSYTPDQNFGSPALSILKVMRYLSHWHRHAIMDNNGSNQLTFAVGEGKNSKRLQIGVEWAADWCQVGFYILSGLQIGVE